MKIPQRERRSFDAVGLAALDSVSVFMKEMFHGLSALV